MGKNLDSYTSNTPHIFGAATVTILSPSKNIDHHVNLLVSWPETGILSSVSSYELIDTRYFVSDVRSLTIVWVVLGARVNSLVGPPAI